MPGLPAATRHGRPLLSNARRIVSGRTKQDAWRVAGRAPGCPSVSFTGFTRRSDVTTMPRPTPSSRRSGPVAISPESETRTSRLLRIWCTRGTSVRRTDASRARSLRLPRSTSRSMRSSCGRGSPRCRARVSGAGCSPSTCTRSHAVTLSSSQAGAISAPAPPPRHHRCRSFAGSRPVPPNDDPTSRFDVLWVINSEEVRRAPSSIHAAEHATGGACAHESDRLRDRSLTREKAQPLPGHHTRRAARSRPFTPSTRRRECSASGRRHSLCPYW